jgi:hypothetical protein
MKWNFGTLAEKIVWHFGRKNGLALCHLGTFILEVSRESGYKRKS